MYCTISWRISESLCRITLTFFIVSAAFCGVRMRPAVSCYANLSGRPTVSISSIRIPAPKNYGDSAMGTGTRILDTANTACNYTSTIQIYTYRNLWASIHHHGRIRLFTVSWKRIKRCHAAVSNIIIAERHLKIGNILLETQEIIIHHQKCHSVIFQNNRSHPLNENGGIIHFPDCCSDRHTTQCGLDAWHFAKVGESDKFTSPPPTKGHSRHPSIFGKYLLWPTQLNEL